MVRQKEVRGPAYDWICDRPLEAIFDLSELYKFLERNYPTETSGRGDAASEPRFQDDVRWAVKDAELRGLIVGAGWGLYRRTDLSRQLGEALFLIGKIFSRPKRRKRMFSIGLARIIHVFDFFRRHEKPPVLQTCCKDSV